MALIEHPGRLNTVPAGPRPRRAWAAVHALAWASASARSCACAFALGLGLVAVPAMAQFVELPLPQPVQAQRWASPAQSEQAYRADAARHLYARYPGRIYPGRLPPQLYGVLVVDTDLAEDGRVLAVQVRRAPAEASELAPWVALMIQAAAPFPPPSRLGQARYTDIWLVHRGGGFQLDTLTQGQD